MAHEIDGTSPKKTIFKEAAGRRAGNAPAALSQISLPQDSRPINRIFPRQVIFHAKFAQALSGMALAAVLLSTFLVWQGTYSQQAQAAPNSDPDFTLVALPDTQYYTDQIRGAKVGMFTTQTQWVADNKVTENIKAVIGLGDIVDNGDVLAEWQRADSAYRILDKAAVPYAPVLGNHDYDDSDGLDDRGNRAAKNYNTYFGPSRFAGYSWYGGGYPAGSNESFYITFTSGTKTYLVLALEYYPRTQALQWAQKIVADNPDKEVIITTHGYLDAEGRWLVKGGHKGPPKGLTSDNDNDAEEMWMKLVKRYRNIILVVSGHICQGISIMARRSDLGDNGNRVHQLLSDYQWFTNGGSGYMRIMKFRPSKGLMEVRTYSPYLNSYLTDATNQFVLTYSE